MQETTFNPGQDIKKNSEFHRKKNNNLPIVVPFKRMREKIQKNLSSRRERSFEGNAR